MQTRSQTLTQQKENEFVFDFDSSSRAWRANKIKLNNGCYEYKQIVTKDSESPSRYNTRSVNKL